MDAALRGVTDAVRLIASDAIREEGVDLVDLEFRRESVGWVLRLFIDKQGGVSLTDCQRVSQVVGTLMEVEDPIPHHYTLEVSSPGLTRALASPEDWSRAEGKLVKLVTREPIAGTQSLVGRVLGAGADGIRIEVEGEVAPLEIGYAMIARARMEIGWPTPAVGGKQGRGGKSARPGGPRRGPGKGINPARKR
jgi:ribosome maturation factor RimP